MGNGTKLAHQSLKLLMRTTVRTVVNRWLMLSPLLQMIFLFSTCALPASCHFSLSEPSDPPAGVSSVSVWESLLSPIGQRLCKLICLNGWFSYSILATPWHVFNPCGFWNAEDLSKRFSFFQSKRFIHLLTYALSIVFKLSWEVLGAFQLNNH